MIKIIKSEMLKYRYGKSIYLCILVVFLIPVMEFSIMQISASLGASGRITEDVLQRFLNANGDQIFRSLYYVLFNGGSLFITATVMTTIIIAEDYMHGTEKYMMVLSSRDKLAKGKVVTLMLIGTLLHFGGLVSSLGIALVARKNFYGIFNVQLIFLYILLGWLVVLAYMYLVGIICSMIDHVAGSIACGLGVYLIGWGFATYLPESVKAFIFMNAAMQIGSSDKEVLLKYVVVCVVTITVFMSILYRQIQKKVF